eukprot:GDKJ01062737.1.p1 GENE.GDKJ01062737.1~~GDKJ01062737.1.p1  ORF type:complete len:325 (-),score=63.96 GDKJ01062737.1:177-1151(-)
MPPKQSVSLDDFDMAQTLGTGAFGRVFLVKSKNASLGPIGEPYAVKRLKKYELIRQKQVDHIVSERAILMEIRHPFIVQMPWSFHDARYLYLVLEYVVGGEFFNHLRKLGRFVNEVARFYAAQICLILEYLHAKNIIYRDLKPENILLSRDGYIKLTDFGFAKKIELRTYTLCGTPEYIAPEVLLNKGHGKPVDWWTFGILVYEMSVGYPPFVDEDPMGIYQKILAGKIVFPRFFDKNAKSLCKRLLTADLARRFGNLKNGPADVKNHKWFAEVDFDKILCKQVTAPYRPLVHSKDDTSNFDSYPDSEDQPLPVPASQDPFHDW